MEIGERIKLAREAVVMTKSELARRVGVHPSACIQWESEGGTHPKVEHLSHVAVVLDVRFEWLATGRGEMRYDPAVRDERPAYSGAESRLSSDEKRLLDLYRGLSPRKRKSLLDVIDGMATGREDHPS
ncbi:MAG: helix-turn-helix domain-containing protein [Pseudomonadota bacterium]